MTTFGDTVYQWNGVPVDSGLPHGPFNPEDNDIYFVRAGDQSYYGDYVAGNDGNDGKSWKNAFATIQHAFDTVNDGDIICLHGEFTESAYTPYKGIGSDHVTVIGVGPHGPRYGTDNTKWQAASGGTYCVDVRAQGWTFQNICFNCPDAGGAIVVNKSGSGTTEKKADETWILGNYFVNGGAGIHLVGAPNECRVEGNTFRRQRSGYSTAIYLSSTASQVPRRWIVKDNLFQDNDNHIHVDANGWLVVGNHFSAGYQATLVETCALSGRLADQGNYNTVQGNYFTQTIANITPGNGYQDGTSSYWSGNWCIDGLYNEQYPQ